MFHIVNISVNLKKVKPDAIISPRKDDVKFSKFLVKDIGVAVVPGSSFYHEPELGRSQVRFTFCKRDETLAAAEERLQKLKSIPR